MSSIVLTFPWVHIDLGPPWPSQWVVAIQSRERGWWFIGLADAIAYTTRAGGNGEIVRVPVPGMVFEDTDDLTQAQPHTG